MLFFVTMRIRWPIDREAYIIDWRCIIHLPKLRLRIAKIEEHTKNITQAQSQLRICLLRPNQMFLK